MYLILLIYMIYLWTSSGGKR